MTELWDLLDAERRPLGKTHTRGLPLPAGAYHLAVFVWVFNAQGQVLLTRRAPEKAHYGGLWAATGGAAIAGENSREAVKRELCEETGLCARAEDFVLLQSVRSDERAYFSDIYLLRADVPLEDLTMQPGETTEALWASRETLESLIARGEFAAPDAARYFAMKADFAEYLR